MQEKIFKNNINLYIIYKKILIKYNKKLNIQ